MATPVSTLLAEATLARVTPLFAEISLEMGPLLRLVVASLLFAGVGVVVFLFAFWIIVKVTPFSIRKEIEHDQNTALGIVIGAVLLGLAMIISSAIRG
jgi:uncharacterized membrane protein YjfL (UPF0719 family)